MSLSIDDEPALVIHSRPYQEHSLLLELFTLNLGRISAVVRLKSSKNSSNRGLFEPFTLLRLSLCQGRSTLFRVNSAMMQKVAYKIEIPYTFSAIYINELLFKLVRAQESDPKLFAQYIRSLEELEAKQSESLVLRKFESVLLESLGYQIDFKTQDQKKISEEKSYFFSTTQGFVEDLSSTCHSYSGKSLIKIMNHEYDCEDSLKILKKIHAAVIKELLGDYELKSRKLYEEFIKY